MSLTPAAADILKLQNLGVQLGSKKVLQNVDFSLKAGQTVCLLGPSGCGKSTLLKTVAGLIEPTEGRLHWQSKKPRTGFVFQDPQLLNWRTALENVRLPLELVSGLKKNSRKSLSEEEKNERSLKALQKVGLSEASTLFPHQLSGGMRMRVSIARALVGEPTLLLLDEPFAALDEVTRFRLQEELALLTRAQNLTVIFVTHSSFEAAFLADRVVILGRSPSANEDKTVDKTIGKSSATFKQVVFDQELNFTGARNSAWRKSAQYQEWIQVLTTEMNQCFADGEASL